MARKHNLVRELMLGQVTRLRYIPRYSICHRQHTENVAEHSYFTAFYVLALWRDAISVGLFRADECNLGVALARALAHDLDETASGDFIRMFKRSSPALTKEVNAACTREVIRLAKKLHDSEAMVNELARDWIYAKEGGYEGVLVALADYMSCASYILQELQSGNHSMAEHFGELEKYADEFSDERFDLFRLILADVRALMDEARAMLERNQVDV